MAIDDRGRLTNNNNTIDDVLHTVNMSSSSFADNKSIRLLSQNAPVNPLNNNIVDFFANYKTGPYEMEWFRQYDHYLHHSSSNLGTVPNLLTHNQIGGTNVVMNALGWNQRSYLLSNHPDIDDRGTIGWTEGSIFSYYYRGVNNSGLEAKATAYGLGGAASTYNPNMDTEVISTSVRNMGVTNIDRGFISSSKALVAFRNAADGEDTWGRVVNVSTTGVITFENAFEISTGYNQIFNKALNVGNGKVVVASHRGGNDINLIHFKYNSTNNYNYGLLEVANTQHNCFPTMGYINDDLMVYFYTRRAGTSGFDQYINAKLYDTSVVGTAAPTVLATAPEYNIGSQTIGQAPDCAVGRSTGTTNAFGIFVYNHTTDHKGRAVPFEVTFKQGNTGTNTVRILPTGTSVLTQTTASTRVDTSDAYRNPVHVIALGTDPADSSRFLYFCTTSPGYGWIIQQNTSTGAISTKVEGVLEVINSSNNFRRCDMHWFGMPGNGARGILGGGAEWARVTAIIAGEYGTPAGDMYVGSAGLLFG